MLSDMQKNSISHYEGPTMTLAPFLMAELALETSIPVRFHSQRLLTAPPNGVSLASHTQVGGWTVDPVCLLSSLCSHLHGDSTPSGAGQPAQVSHPSLCKIHGGAWLWGGPFFVRGGYREFLSWTPFLLCTNRPLSRNPHALYSHLPD